MADTALAAILFLRSTAITADTDLGERIYMSVAPQSAAFPYAVMEIVSRVESPTQDSGSAVDTYRIQVDVYAKAGSGTSGFETASTIAHDLRVAWSREAGDSVDSIQESNYFSDFIPDLNVNRVSNDYMIRVLQSGEVMGTQIIKRQRVSFAYAYFSAAALTNTITSGFTLPVNASLLFVQTNVPTMFAGTSITFFSLSFGKTGSLSYWGGTANLVSYTTPQLLTTAPGLASTSETTDVKITATSIGANLSALTAGQVDLWIYYTILN